MAREINTGAPKGVEAPVAAPKIDMGSPAGLAQTLDAGPAGAGIRTLASVDAPSFLPPDAANAGKTADQVLGGAPTGTEGTGGVGQAPSAEAGVVGQPGLNEATVPGNASSGVEAPGIGQPPPAEGGPATQPGTEAGVLQGGKPATTVETPSPAAVSGENPSASVDTPPANPVDSRVPVGAALPDDALRDRLGMEQPQPQGSKLGETRTDQEIKDITAPPGESPLDAARAAKAAEATPAEASSPTATETPSPAAEATTPAEAKAAPTKAEERQKRIDDLNAKRAAGKANHNDLSELKKLSSMPEDPGARLQELKDMDPREMTDANMNEYVALSSEIAQDSAADAGARRNILERRTQEGTITEGEKAELKGLQNDRLNDLKAKREAGNAFDEADWRDFGKFAKDEDIDALTGDERKEMYQQQVIDKAAEIIDKAYNDPENLTAADVAELQELNTNKMLADIEGISPADARDIAKNAFAERRLNGKQEKMLKAAENLREDIKKLMGLEMQILAIPKQKDAIKQERDESRRKCEELSKDAPLFGQGEEAMEKRLPLFAEMDKLAQLNAQLVGLNHMALRLNMERVALQVAVEGKLGVRSLGSQLLRMTGAVCYNVVGNAYADTADNVNYAMGNFG